MSKPFKIILRRFDDIETNKVVGFDIILNNRSTKYFEKVIPYSDCAGKNTNEICHLSYRDLKPEIQSFVSSSLAEPNIVPGSEYIPPD